MWTSSARTICPDARDFVTSPIGRDAARPVSEGRAWLAEFAYLLEGSTGDGTTSTFAAFDRQAWGIETPQSWLDFFTSPTIPAYVFQSRRSTAALTQWSLGEIVQHDPVPIRVDFLEVWTDPHEVFHHLLTTSGKGSRRATSETARFERGHSQVLRSSIEGLTGAIQLLQHVAPGFSEDVRVFSHRVAIADQGASFRGSSGVAYRGLMLFSPPNHWTELHWAEELVHESTHNILITLCANQTLVEGDGQLFPAPFRSEARPAHGNMHALTVAARCVSLFDACIDTNIEVEHFKTRRDYFLAKGHNTYSAMKGRVRLSQLGQSLWDDLITPAFS